MKLPTLLRKLEQRQAAAGDGAARVRQLLAIAAAFERAARPVPGHVLRELVVLRGAWARHPIPDVVRRAAAALDRTNPTT